jgi:hypothetical protein
MTISNPRIAAVFLTLTGFLAAGVLPARAVIPKSDIEFVDSHLPLLTKVKDQTLAKPVTPLNIFEGIRKIADLRRQAMVELNGIHPLSDIDGIETLDHYDDGAVHAVHDLTSAFTARDSTGPSPEQLQQFNGVLGGIPTLGESPVGFMIFGIADLAFMVTDTLWADPAVSRPELAKTAINLIHVAAGRYTEGQAKADIVDPTFFKKSGRFRTNSVIMRMQCPKDHAVYRIVDIRNRSDSEGNMLSTYYIQCQVCDDPRVIEFVQEFQSRLNRIADRQRGQDRKKSPPPGKAVEP